MLTILEPFIGLDALEADSLVPVPLTSPSNGGGGQSGILPWVAVLGAWLFFGSFSVPMKFPSVVEAKVHPLVFQCYKTFWTFASSFLVLLFEPFEFTWWGVLSGLAWVPAGVCAVIAVQNIGIACGQAIWQVTIIGTSFFWGFVILRDEHVHTWYGTAGSLLALVVGLVGMTISFNLKPKTGSFAQGDDTETEESAFQGGGTIEQSSTVNDGSLDVEAHDAPPLDRTNSTSTTSSSSSSSSTTAPPPPAGKRGSFALGVGAALFNGVWGGSNLVPSLYAPFHGVHFVISFGVGAAIINATMLLLYFAACKLVWGCEFPPLHLKVMAVPGFISGMLWSAGNFCALYVVSTMGQGIGYSLVQCSVIVSGLWGLLYYGEMRGRAICYWCFFLMVCCAGIVGISLEKAN